MWIKCGINGDLINLNHIEEIEITEKKGTIGSHFELEVVFANNKEQNPKKRKPIWIGSYEECERYRDRIGKVLSAIYNPDKDATLAKAKQATEEARKGRLKEQQKNE